MCIRDSKKVEKFFGPEADAKVTATVEKNIKIVEITLSKGGFIFRSQESSQDLEDALAKCVDSLIRQIRKNKTRLAKRIRDVSFDEAFNSADDSAEEEYDIVLSLIHISMYDAPPEDWNAVLPQK